MKKYLFTLSFLALIFFIDYFLIVLTALVLNVSGVESQFFYGPFKYIGFTIIGVSLFGSMLYLRRVMPKFNALD